VICSNWGKMICNSGTIIYDRNIVAYNRSTVICSNWGKSFTELRSSSTCVCNRDTDKRKFTVICIRDR